MNAAAGNENNSGIPKGLVGYVAPSVNSKDQGATGKYLHALNQSNSGQPKQRDPS